MKVCEIFMKLMSIRASPAVFSNVTLHKTKLSHPTFVMYFLATAPINSKLKLQIGGRLLIAKDLDQSL